MLKQPPAPQVGGGAKGTKNPAGEEGTKEGSSEGQPSASDSGDTSGDGPDADAGDSQAEEQPDEPEEEEAEAEEPAPEFTVATVPYDPRFPGINQVSPRPVFSCAALGGGLGRSGRAASMIWFQLLGVPCSSRCVLAWHPRICARCIACTA